MGNFLLSIAMGVSSSSIGKASWRPPIGDAEAGLGPAVDERGRAATGLSGVLCLRISACG